MQVTVLSAALATLSSVPLGLARMSRHQALRLPVAAVVEFLRGTSLPIQLF